MFERKEINKILNKMGFLKWSQQLNKITPDKYQKYQAQLEELINDLLDNTLEDFIQYEDYDDIFTNDIMTYAELLNIVDDHLKSFGIKSRYINLVDKIINESYTDEEYVKINANLNNFEVINIQKRTNEFLQKKYLLIEYLENYY